MNQTNLSVYREIKLMRKLFLILSIISGSSCLSQAQGDVFDSKKGEANKASVEQNQLPKAVVDRSAFKETDKSYRSKAVSWKEVCIASPKNEVAWQNYYYALRYQMVGSLSKSVSPKNQKVLDSVENEISKVLPNSFTYHLVSYENAQKSQDASDHLLAANRLQPLNADLYDDMTAHYEQNGNSAKKKEFLLKCSKSNKYSVFKMEFATNMLKSVSRNGVLITYGEVDTYPIWILQEVNGFRTDVKVINLDLVQNEKYWENLKTKYGIGGEWSSSKVSFINNILNNSTSNSVFVSTTVNPSILQQLKSKLFVVGNIFQLSNTPIDNMVLLQNNVKSYKTSSLKSKNKLYSDKQLSKNYLIGLINLYNWQKSKGDSERYETKLLAKQLAEENNIWHQIKPKFD